MNKYDIEKLSAEEREAMLASIKADIAAISVDFGELPKFTGAYGKPKIRPAYSHPRLWVNKDTIQTVIDGLSAEENRYAYDTVIAHADVEYTGVLPPLAEGKLRNFEYEDMGKLEALAFMYLTSGDEIYGYAAIRAAKNFLATIEVPPKTSDVPFYGWSGNDIYDISHNSSSAMEIMAKIYDWCFDIISPEDREYILKGSVNRLASNLEVLNPPTNSGCVTGHGTATLTLRDWPALAIAVVDEHPEIYDHIMGLLENYYVPAPNWYYRSGANFQGSGYGINKTILHLVSELLVYIMSGKKLYADDVSFEATLKTFISYLRPDGESLRIGDDYACFRSTRYSTDYTLQCLGAFYYKDPIIKAWAKYQSDDYKKIDMSGGKRLLTSTMVLLFNDATVKCIDSDRAKMPLVNYNGSPVGAIIGRSAWCDPNAWMTYTKIGEAYGGNHEHKDSGTFQIYYKGILAPETGAYQYYGGELNQSYGSPYDRAYVKQTISKNGLLIYNPKYKGYAGRWLYSGGQTIQGDSAGENSTLDEWLSKTTSHQARELAHAYGYAEDGSLDYTYISGDITDAYDRDTVSLVVRSTVSVATGDEAHPLMFAVYDRIIARNPDFKKTFLLHTMDEPEFIEGKNAFTYTNKKGANGVTEEGVSAKYNGRLTNTTLLPASPEYEVIGGDGKRFWIEGENRGNEGVPTDKPVYEIGWGRVEISTKGRAEDSFLNVMYVGDADGDNTYVPAELVSTETHEGAISFNNCVMFSKSNERIADTVSLTAESGGKLSYYVTGLASGEWKVSINGTYALTVTVEESSGVAVFTAPSGKVDMTLTK